MEKIKNVNCYSKEGHLFVVFTTNDNKSYSCNIGLLKYAIEHTKEVKKNENQAKTSK